MKNKSKKLNILYFMFILFFILTSTSYLIYKYNLLMEYNSQVTMLEQEIQTANEQKEELINQMQYKTSLEYIEKLAREQLGMVKSDEIIFYNQNE